jgi:putative ABC transport system permease protein
MNIRRLAWKNLLRRKSRALFTGLGIFLGIGTFVALSSLTVRMEGAVRDKLDKYGANILITPRAEQVSLGFGDISLGGAQVDRARLTTDDGKAIRSIALHERIRVAAPYFLAAADASGRQLVWMGVSVPEIADARPWWKISGSPIRERGEVLLGSEAAAALDKGPGGSVTSGKRTFRVAGILHPTGEKEDAMVIGDIRDVQALAGNQKGVTFFEVAAQCKDCPVEDIVEQIGSVLPGAKVSAIRQVVQSRKEAVDQFRRIGAGISAIVLVIAGLMVVVTVMGNVQERTREIGVLRAVGFRRRAILSLLFWETGWISLLASAGGAAAGLVAGTLVLPLFGMERGGFEGIALSPAFLGIAIGMGLGLLGTVLPARKAAALSPTEAIRSL